MFKLIKYDWLRRWKFFLAGIITFLLANVNLMGSYTRQARHTSNVTVTLEPQAGAIDFSFNASETLSAILISLCFALAIGLFIDHIGRLYRSLFTDEGYLEFALPLRGYQLLGGKLLAVIFECIAVIAVICITLYLDALYLSKSEPLPVRVSISWQEGMTLVQLILLIVAVYIAFLLMVYLSMTLAKTLFASFKYGKLVAFLCFLVILVISEIIGTATDQISDRLTGTVHLPEMIIGGSELLIVAVMLVVLFLSTSYLLDRKINL